MISHLSETNSLTVRETDEAGNPTATYVYSGDVASSITSSKTPAGRVDVISSSSSTSSWSAKLLVSSLSDVFLPSGYPQSVSDDYLPYQIFDSLQAFCSSIAGLLSSRAVLQGVGVGNASASPTSALLLQILQDISGRIATICFAHRVGTALEPECKTYRLAADVFNDIAMILDCLSPGVPAGPARVIVLSTAGVLRALCGVAGGSSKASLSAHFAKWGNLAELNAKDSSQETVISLFGMLVGSVVISHITSFSTTWLVLLFLLALHLSMNYAAVRAVRMTSLNRQRANIVFSALLASDKSLALALELDLDSTTPAPPKKNWTILTPAQVAEHERIFHRDGALQWTQHSGTHTVTHHLGSAQIGVSVSTFLGGSGSGSTLSALLGGSVSGSTSFRRTLPLQRLATVFADEFYILFLVPSAAGEGVKWHGSILLKRGCAVEHQLKAWAHALLAARVLARITMGSSVDAVLTVVEGTLALLNTENRFEKYLTGLSDVGWDVDIAALETRGGRRIDL
ncbi:RUS1 family protein-like protein [Penicillium digitatum]|uniref:RUS1 family protein-like protein n=1 Tax=Penicillium digitatum TaxID=36651 RepID=A0A7T6XII8_PENDI|nr:RUS1 family protein-like protein [Penicillium digitatum]